ncbi:MAG: hypothetical protein ABSB78_12755 [Bacteroidota bacterium]
MEFRDDVPPSGGNRSVFISGGCIVPHAYFTLISPASESYLSLRCRGKNLSSGGEIQLRRISDWKKNVWISINDTVWAPYQSADTLFCPALDTLSLELTSGGLKPSAMLVDLIEVLRVK